MESAESYASPIPHEAGGKTQLLVVGGDCLTGHDLKTGAELWRAKGINPKGGEWMRVVASPVSAAGVAVACGPKGEPLLAFRTDGKGDVTESGLAWKFDEKKTPDVCTPAFADGKLFVLDGDRQTLTALDPKSGAKLWQGNLGHRDTIRSSPTIADGKIFTVSESGKVVVCDITGP
jgi:outer membrane protein assembly factor BamB